MYSSEIASFLGSLQKLTVDEYMLYSIVLLQGCGIMYKVVMWRLGCRRSGKKKVTLDDDVEKQLGRIVVVQPAESKKVPVGRGSAVSVAQSGVHSITMEQEDDKATVKATV